MSTCEAAHIRRPGVLWAVGGCHRIQTPRASSMDFFHLSHRWQLPTRSIRTNDAGLINCLIRNPGLSLLIGCSWGHKEGGAWVPWGGWAAAAKA